MSSGSGASNLGYGNIAPLSNINGKYVNVDSSNSPATFGSNEISGSPPGIFGLGLAGAKSNIDGAAGIVPGICLFKGGAKNLKRKIKNITKKYKKMKAGSRKMKSLKKKIKSKIYYRNLAKNASYEGGKHSRRLLIKNKSRKHRRRQNGGYAQYQNNLPMTETYKVAGVYLPASESALAAPPPVTVLPNCVNCVDNYNHYTNMGFPSRGH
jgi:hypothetical protein